LSESQERGIQSAELLVERGLLSLMELPPGLRPPQPVAAPSADSLFLSGAPGAEGGGSGSSGSRSVEALRPEIQVALANPSSPRLGRYLLLGELGRGGFGVVYRGYDPELRREVAIKQLIPQEGETASTLERRLQRFQLEGRAAAKLAHPLIVGAFEVGSDGGRPFLVMEFVEGQDLETLLGREELSLRRRVELLRDVAEALGHAHQNGIVHRDVKPGNVMVDGSGRARLTDFGLARDVEAGGGLSRTGQVMGTPLFLSPEQAAGRPDLTRPATDVFALGGVCYMVLTGQPPFPGQNMMELLGMISSADPIRPSKINPLINRDLETIVLKCLEKDQARRYQEGGEVARELERFLAGEAIEARPLSGGERLLRLAARNKLVTLLTLALSLSIVVGGLYGVWAIKVERDIAQRERARALESKAEAEAARLESDRARSAAEKARAEAEAQRLEAARAAEREAEARERAEGESRAKDLLLTQALAEKGDRLLAQRRHGRAAALYAASLRKHESVQARSGLAYAMQFARPERWGGGRSPLSGVAPLDGERFVVGTQRGEILCYDKKGIRQADFEGHRGPVTAIDVAAGVVVAGLESGKFAIWGAEAPTEATLIEAHEGEVRALAWSLDGKELATVGADQLLKRWRPSGELVASRSLGFSPLCVAWSPDRAWLAVGGAGGLVVLRARDGALARAPESGWIAGVGFGPQGLWSGDLSGRLSLWSIEGANSDPALRRSWTESVSFPLTALALSPQGKIALGSSLGDLHCYDPARREWIYRTRVGSRWITGLRWLDEDSLTTADLSGLVGLHSVASRREVSTMTPGTTFNDLVVSPAGKDKTAYYAAGEDGAVWLGVAENSKLVNRRGMTRKAMTAIAISADSKVLAGASYDRQVVVNYLLEKRYVVLEGTNERVPSALVFGEGYDLAAAVGDEVLFWKLPGLAPARRIKAPGPVLALARGPGGRVALAVEGAAILYDSSGAELARLPLGGKPRAIALEPGSHRVAVAVGRLIQLWDPTAPGRPIPLRGHNDLVSTLAFGPRAKYLVSGGTDTWVCVWDLTTGSLNTVLEGHAENVNAVAVDPRGRFVMSAGQDGVLRTWELHPPNAARVLQLGGWSLGLMSDGRIVSSGGADGVIRALDPRDGVVRPMLRAKRPVSRLATGPKGLLALAMDKTPEIEVFDLTKRKPLYQLRHERPVTSICISLATPPILAAVAKTRVKTWNLETGEPAQAWDLDAADQIATGLSASADGKWLVFGVSRRVRLFSLGGLAGPSFPLPEGHGSYGVNFSPDARYLGVASQGARGRVSPGGLPGEGRFSGREIKIEGEAQLIELRGERVQVLRRHDGFSFAAVFSPDGRFLAEGGGGVILWDAKTGRRWAELIPPKDETGRPSMVFSQGGDVLVSRGSGQTSIGWRLRPLGIYDSAQEAADRAWDLGHFRVVGMDAVRVERELDYLVRQRLKERGEPR